MGLGKIAYATAVLFFLTVLGACSSAPKKASISIRGEADPVLNRDINGKSLSVEIRVYQLKDAKEFSKLTFDTLVSGRPEAELFGSALLEKTDAILVPGGSYASSEKLLDDTRFVGIVGLFRNPDPHYWRQLIDVSSPIGQQGAGNRDKVFSFRLRDCYIQIDGAGVTPLPDQSTNIRPECQTANLTKTGSPLRSPGGNPNNTSPPPR